MPPTSTANASRISPKAGRRSAAIHSNANMERLVARRDMRNSSTMSIMKISTAQTANAPRIAVKKRLAT